MSEEPFISVEETNTSPAVVALLEVMRSPEHLIHSIHETCDFLGDAVMAKTTLHISAPEYAVEPGFIYIDIQHPRKGFMATISHVGDQGFSTLTHQQHISVSKELIIWQLSKLGGSIKMSPVGSSKHAGDICEELYRAQSSLLAIPDASESRAKNLLADVFDNSGRLKIFDKYDGVNFNSMIAQGIYELCARLTERYLYLVQVPLSSSGEATLSFTAVRHLTEGKLEYLSGQSSKGTLPARYYALGGRPTSLRMHLPWAKRTKNYTVSADSPCGQFFKRVSVVKRKRRREHSDGAYGGRRGSRSALAEIRKKTPDAFSWAVNYRGGMSFRVFIGDARKEAYPIYLGIRHHELPGRSTLRMAFLATVATLMTICGILVQSSDLSSILLALVAVGAIANPSPSGKSGHQLPILSRGMPGFIGITTGILLVWLHTKQSSIFLWSDLGGWIIFVLQAIAAIWLIGRAVNIAYSLKKVSTSGEYFGGALY
ncbi:hypothetical protein GWK74_04350 [Candidatus Saccharibacteria bacterium oral taxon 488]|nr:hypothetical protein GWK74_04350 [Candidatus Saccharibacteria bacterium oral taxon 488]